MKGRREGRKEGRMEKKEGRKEGSKRQKEWKAERKHGRKKEEGEKGNEAITGERDDSKWGNKKDALIRQGRSLFNKIKTKKVNSLFNKG